MNQGDYDDRNRVKASFDAAYTAATPHQYLQNMTAVNYRMAGYMDPIVSAAVDASATDEGPVRVLDLGCSYGVSGALLKSDRSYDEVAAFFRDEASTDYASCVAEARLWLASHVARKDVEVVGFDSSEEAVRFATAARMIDNGIACNLEEDASGLTGDESSLIRHCDVLLSTGVIGYVTDKTVEPILDEFGTQGSGALGPVAVVSVLDLFDPAPIAAAFTDHGYRFGQLPVRLPQRCFVDDEERAGVAAALRERGLVSETHGVDDKMFASLCVAAQPPQFHRLAERVADVVAALPPEVRVEPRDPVIHIEKGRL